MAAGADRNVLVEAVVKHVTTAAGSLTTPFAATSDVDDDEDESDDDLDADGDVEMTLDVAIDA